MKNKKYSKLVEEAKIYFRQEKLKEAIETYEEAFKIKTILKLGMLKGLDIKQTNKE